MHCRFLGGWQASPAAAIAPPSGAGQSPMLQRAQGHDLATVPLGVALVRRVLEGRRAARGQKRDDATTHHRRQQVVGALYRGEAVALGGSGYQPHHDHCRCDDWALPGWWVVLRPPAAVYPALHQLPGQLPLR